MAELCTHHIEDRYNKSLKNSIIIDYRSVKTKKITNPRPIIVSVCYTEQFKKKNLSNFRFEIYNCLNTN